MSTSELAAFTSTLVRIRRTFFRASILTLISIIAFACGGSPPQKTDNPGQVVETEYIGRVINAQTQQPVSKAKITLDFQGVPPITYTDTEGIYRFTVPLVTEITGQVRVDAENYETYTRTITLSPSARTIEDIRLTTLQATPTAVTSAPTSPSTPSATETSIVQPPALATAPNRETTGNVWQGKYYGNTSFQEPAVLTREDPAPIFDWKDSNPGPGMPIDNFSIRWTSCPTFEERYYIFSARADDHVKVYLDDIFVLEAGNKIVERPFAISAGQHCIKVEYSDGYYDASVYFDYQPGESLPSADGNTGWKGEYFNNTGFQEPVNFTRSDPAPIFDWKDSNPGPGMPIDNFSIRWTKCMMFEDRYYVFTARADDHVKVYLDDIFVLEAGNNIVERPFAVSAGQHCIKVEYSDGYYDASIYFDYQPGEGYQTADENTAWKGEYFSNTSFQEPVTFKRNDPAPVFNWKDGNPAPNMPIDNFSIRWTKCITFDGRDYIFTARADEHVKVYLDDIFVLEAGGNTVEKPFAVAAGQHCIKLEYVDGYYDASIYFDVK